MPSKSPRVKDALTQVAPEGKGFISPLPGRGPAGWLTFSHSEGRGSSETRLAASLRPCTAPCSRTRSSCGEAQGSGGRLGGGNGLALLWAFPGRAWAGDPGHQPFSSQGVTRGPKRNGAPGSQVCLPHQPRCSAAPTPRCFQVILTLFINKTKIQAALT